jgi:lysophospholipase L1-like esterase
MKTVLAALLSLAAALSGAAQTKPDPYRQIADEPGLPRVLIIGDSISIGYTEPLRELLKGKANVHRIGENGGPTSNGVAHLDQWLGSSKWDVIHFNFGLHDLKIMDGGKHQVPLPEYEANLRTIVARLKSTGARLIWATTTPVPDAKVNPPRKFTDVPEFNAAARRVMDENHIAINDLYGLALPQLERIQLPANVHYTEPGYAVLARQVADAIFPR